MKFVHIFHSNNIVINKSSSRSTSIIIVIVVIVVIMVKKRKQPIDSEDAKYKIVNSNALLLARVEKRRENNLSIIDFENIDMLDVTSRPKEFCKMPRVDSLICTMNALNNILPKPLSDSMMNYMSDSYFYMLAQQKINMQIVQIQNEKPQPLQLSCPNTFIPFDKDSDGYSSKSSKNWSVDCVGFLHKVTKNPSMRKVNISSFLRNDYVDYTPISNIRDRTFFNFKSIAASISYLKMRPFD